MTIVSLKAGNTRRDGMVKAEFSDGSSLLFLSEYLPDSEKISSLGESERELSAGEEEAFRFAAACYRAEKAALRLIARAEQNSLALAVKLERRGHDTDIVKAVVSRLRERDLINDGRYAELWVRSRLTIRKAMSPRWLLHSLGKRGINRNHSQQALEGILDPETEYALLLRFIERIKRGNSRIPENKREKFLRAQLKYEGFSITILDRYFNH